MKQIVSKRTLVASLLGLTAFGAVFGSAAGLGGVSSGGLGADATVVSSCDTNGVGLAYTRSYDATAPAGYKVTAVTVSGVADTCDGQNLAVTLTNSANSSLASGTTTIPTSAAVDHTVGVSPSASVSSVANTHVVIAP